MSHGRVGACGTRGGSEAVPRILCFASPHDVGLIFASMLTSNAICAHVATTRILETTCTAGMCGVVRVSFLDHSRRHGSLPIPSQLPSWHDVQNGIALSLQQLISVQHQSRYPSSSHLDTVFAHHADSGRAVYPDPNLFVLPHRTIRAFARVS